MDGTGPAGVSRSDKLVRWDRAALALNVSQDSLTAWFQAGFVPAVQTPGLFLTYQSWIDDVRNGMRPGRAANVMEIGRKWFADRGLLEEAA